jgi:hypothetical protein
MLLEVKGYVCVNICCGGVGCTEPVEGVVVAEEDEAVEGTRRLGRGRMGREAIRLGGSGEAVGEEDLEPEYCCGPRTAAEGIVSGKNLKG